MKSIQITKSALNYKMNHPNMNEEFLEFESKVDQVMRLLEDMSNANKTDADAGQKGDAKAAKLQEVSEDNFIVCVRQDRTSINRSVDKPLEPEGPKVMDKFTFMQQMEEDAKERDRVRQERERIAQNFRSLGNEAFRKLNYEKAIIMFTKAIEHVKDSPILYNNRAICYMRLRNYKRAIMDCDYVINKLQEKNLQAWLYRAASYRRLNDEKNFESSVKLAKKHNTKEHAYIDTFLDKMRTEL